MINGDVGLIGFNDIGRVRHEDEGSNKWHHGYGGGIYLTPFNIALISATYNMSRDDKLFVLNFGFFF